MKTKFSKSLIPLLIVGLSAFAMGCPSDDDPDNDDEEFIPSISVDDQTLEADEADEIAVTEATIDDDGFAVIHEEDDGEAGDVIGATDLLEEGDYSDLAVTLDRDAQDGETLWAMLHYDETEAGEFEDADDQPPVTGEDGDVVQDSFEISIADDEITPSISIEDQTLDEDAADEVNVDEATIDDDGLVAIYDEDDGDFDEQLGTADIDEGDNTDVTVGLNRDATDGETLWGVLYYGEDDRVSDEDGDDVADSFEITIDDDANGDDDDNAVSASNQTLDVADGDLSTIVTADEATIEDDGWLVIHDDECGEGGGVIGYSWLEAGTSDDVEVELMEPAADQDDNRDLCAMLHDDDGDESFDAGDDEPIEDDDGDIVEDTFTVTVTEGTPAIRITIGADDNNEFYTKEDVEPSVFDGDVGTDNDDLTFEFRQDWRYEIDNTVTGNHPFEFINDEEEVLFSQDTSEGDSGLEDEEDIDWVQDGDIFRFNVVDTFREETGLLGLTGEDRVTSYRCGVHTGAMTGPVDYID